MKYLDFKEKFSDLIVFDTAQIRIVDPNFDDYLLFQWQKKAYLQKISRGKYIFSNLNITDAIKYHIANKIYEPSYISLELALSIYGLIPETVFKITSVSCKKTFELENQIGSFLYKSLKSDLFWGYKIEQTNSCTYQIADFEKAILDFLYLNPKLKRQEDFKAARFDFDTIKEEIDLAKFSIYLDRFDSKALKKRANQFLKGVQIDA